MFTYLLSLPRYIKRTISIILDMMLIICSLYLSLSIRYDFNVPNEIQNKWFYVPILVILTLAIFIKLGLYRSVLRFITLRIARVVIIGCVISSICLVVLDFGLRISIPRTVPFLYCIFLSVTVLSSRIIFRSLLTYNRQEKTRVIIYGAGESGRQLLTALNQTSSYVVMAFIDDNPKLFRSVIHGVTVYSPDKLNELIETRNISKILLAIPSASIGQRKAIIQKLSQYQCEVLSMPGMEDILSGKAKLTTLNKISITDLLGRDPVKPIEDLLNKDIRSKVVMVTGAGGSIGSELCRQIIKQKPKSLILFEMGEYALYQIHSELLSKAEQTKIIPILGTVRDENHLYNVIRTFNIQTLYHAAAYKHVPLVEYNMIEGIQNNIFGTLNAAQAAIKANVETFVLISTDKAVRPTNLMGATKRMAELILQGLAATNPSTRFCMVRFGNVLGSSGSVVPLFTKQIEQGGPITLTHPEITRFFMTIPEAASLVIQAGAMGRGGDVFVLDMGEPVKIIDLAKSMIKLSGLTVRDEMNPQGDIEIKISGLRPGEKLYEELLIGNNVIGSSHPRIMTSKEKMLPWEELSKILSEIEQYCSMGELGKLRDMIISSPIDFIPSSPISDLMWKSVKG